MGPKKKGGKSSKGGKGSGGIIDGVPMSEMSKEQLEKFTVRIQEELEREREERNFFQLERDKLRTFWEITRQQQDESKAEIRNKERALEEADEKHEAEIKVFNQKVKHLIYEHQCRLTEVKAENMVALKVAQEDYSKQEAELVQEKDELKKQIVERQLDHEEELRKVQKNHSEELFGLRTEFMKKIEEMAIRAEKRLQTIRNYYETKNKVEMTQIVENKNEIIHKLETNHTNDLAEMKNYFKGVTENNLALISDLKDELNALKSENEKMKNIIEKLKKENNTLTEPLRKAQDRMKELEKQLVEFKKNKSSLFEMHKRCAFLQKQLDEANNEKDQLEIKVEKMEFERDELQAQYSSIIVDMQKKHSLVLSKMEKKIFCMEKELEKREIQMSQMIQKSNIDPKSIMHATNKLQQAMLKREKKMEKLQIELGKVVKAHDDMLHYFMNLIHSHNISSEEISYTQYEPVFRRFIAELFDDKLFNFSFDDSEIGPKDNEEEY